MTAELITPNRSMGYGYNAEANNKAIEEKKEFELAIVKLLDLPDGYNKYVKFSSSSEFITLQSNDSYNADIFRRFKRGAKAIIPSDLKERVLAHIQRKKESDSRRNEIQKRKEHYSNMVSELLKPFNTETTHVIYENDDQIEKAGVRISLVNKNENDYYTRLDPMGLIYIRHSGVITQACFPHTFGRYENIPISSAAKWIESNREADKNLNELAFNIKAALPIDYFINH